MPTINHTNFLRTVSSTQDHPWLVFLRRMDHIDWSRGRKPGLADEPQVAKDLIDNGYPNLFADEHRKVDVYYGLTRGFADNECHAVELPQMPSFDIVVPKETPIADLSDAPRELYELAARLAQTPPGQNDPATSVLTLEEARRACDAAYLTSAERVNARGIVRNHFFGRASGLGPHTIRAKTYEEPGAGVCVEVLNRAQGFHTGEGFQGRIECNALEVAAPAGTRVLAVFRQADGSGRELRLGDCVLATDATGKALLDIPKANHDGWHVSAVELVFVKPSDAPQQPEVLDRLRLEIPRAGSEDLDWR